MFAGKSDTFSSLQADLREAAEEAACLHRDPQPGEFYRREDTSRGVTLSAVTEVGFGSLGCHGELWDEEPAGTCAAQWPSTPLNACSQQARCSGQASELKAFSDAVCDRFLAPDEPPMVPADASFHLEATTVVVSGSAVEAGNLLLDFFDGEASALITKVNRRKFSFKVEASLQGFTCLIKVRCYQQDSGNAFEFQRCRGDSVAFNSLFRAAAGRLRAPLSPNSAPLATSALPAPGKSALPAEPCETARAQNSRTTLVEPAPLMEVSLRLQDSASIANVDSAVKSPPRALLPCLGHHPEAGMWLSAPFPPTPLEACAKVRCSHSSRSDSPAAAGAAFSRCERFDMLDEPPTVPADASFQLEATTLVVNSSPVDAGNRLLDFFTEDSTAHVTKVNRCKFSFKVEVVLQGFRCLLKVRGYKQDPKCLFEFSRLRGDGVAFNSLFRSASRYMNISKPGPNGSSVDSTVAPSPLDSASANAGDTQNTVTPLLDMAQRARDLKLYVEAAGGLAAAAKGADAETVAQLCTPRACSVIRKLLRVEDFSVACPTAVLLSSLGQHPDAGMWLAAHGLLQAMLERMWSITTGKFLVEELAHAVKHAVSGCCKQLSGAVAQDLATSLKRALDTWVPEDGKGRSARCHLQEALTKLFHEIDSREETGHITKKMSF